MIDPQLLEVLVCPETSQPLRLASPDELTQVNQGVAAGRLRTRGGQAVAEPLQAALVRNDGKLLYRVQDDIPVMLVDQAIVLEDGLPAVSA